MDAKKLRASVKLYRDPRVNGLDRAVVLKYWEENDIVHWRHALRLANKIEEDERQRLIVQSAVKRGPTVSKKEIVVPTIEKGQKWTRKKDSKTVTVSKIESVDGVDRVTYAGERVVSCPVESFISRFTREK